MRNLIVAALFSVAAFAATTEVAQAAPKSYVWHHSTPIHVGNGASTRTHGSTIGARGSRTLRNWYSPRRGSWRGWWR